MQAAVDELVVNMGARYVRFDAAQSLTSGQKTQAQTNLGLAASVPTSRLVNTTAPLAGGGALSGDLTLSLTLGATLVSISSQLRTVAMTGDVTAPANSFVTTVDAKFLQTGVSKNLTIGNTFTANNIGTKSSGSFTPDPTLGNYQFYVNGGAHTLLAPTVDCAIDILVTNNASAGVITFTNFAGGTHGDALTTTNTSIFIISIKRIAAVAAYTIKALQ